MSKGKIVDLTWRLPGPMGTYLLARQGWEVIKYEDQSYRDPFLKWDWDPAFAEIYESFQDPKELRLIEFGNRNHVEKLHREIATSDAVLLALPPRVEEKLGLTAVEIATRYSDSPILFTRLGFRRESSESAHDLNTLAQSGLLKMHILDDERRVIPPPFLPVTGILFSHHIAMSLLDGILECRSDGHVRQDWCYLQDAVDRTQQAYYPESLHGRRPATFLHNGRFPCYNIYRTADGGHVAMATVEPKFWSRFRELTGLRDLSDSDNLAQEPRATEVREVIASCIGDRTTEEWERIFEGEDVCVDVTEW